MKKRRNYQGNSKGTLHQQLRAKQEIAKFKRLSTEASIESIQEKRRAKMEQVEAGYYADLVDWIECYLFPVSTVEELGEKIAEYKTVRKSRLLKLESKLNELEKAVISLDGRNRIIKVSRN